MGLFSNWNKSAKKSSLLKSAAAQVQSGQIKEAISEILDFYQTDEAFMNILKYFDATQMDIENIIKGIMFSGAGGNTGGHYVPISAVLFHDTLAYSLRSERGQISKREAYLNIQEYFQSGAVVFQPEREFH
jgi:hypothetical protein